MVERNTDTNGEDDALHGVGRTVFNFGMDQDNQFGMNDDDQNPEPVTNPANAALGDGLAGEGVRQPGPGARSPGMVAYEEGALDIPERADPPEYVEGDRGTS